jgi:hypothetical protein
MHHGQLIAEDALRSIVLDRRRSRSAFKGNARGSSAAFYVIGKMKSYFIKHKKFIISFFIILYFVSYLIIRSGHILVHRVSYSTNSDAGKTYYHSVTVGDFGTPMITGNSIWMAGNTCYFIYFPRRLAEGLFWKYYPKNYIF